LDIPTVVARPQDFRPKAEGRPKDQFISPAFLAADLQADPFRLFSIAQRKNLVAELVMIDKNVRPVRREMRLKKRRLSSSSIIRNTYGSRPAFPHLPPMGVGVQVIITNHDLALVGDMGGHPGNELQIIHPLLLARVLTVSVTDLALCLQEQQPLQGQRKTFSLFGKKIRYGIINMK